MAQLCGILNVTEDSFSDGTVDLSEAIAHGERLLAAGADWLDIGVESSNPNGAPVPIETQLARLVPVLQHFRDARVAVDTHRPEVMQVALDHGVAMVNDVTALRDPRAVALLQRYDALVVLMHSRASDARAEKSVWTDLDPVGRIIDFFTERLAELPLARERLILDPGMGFFLSSHSEASVEVLRGLPRFKSLGLPLYVCTSRKAFVAPKVAPAQRLPGTLATELFALSHGIDFLRTHDVSAIGQAWSMWQRLHPPSR